ncbi:MAG: DUF1289 domain-containing protein [Gammaproteobacteria bacterium]
MSNETSVAIETPCVSVCQLNDVDLSNPSTYCLGCYRTVGEIARWGRMTSDERRAIMAGLPQRKEQLNQET